MALRGVAVLVLAAALAPACGSKSSGTAPSATNLNGVWNGTSTCVNAPFRVDIVQTGTTAGRSPSP